MFDDNLDMVGEKQTSDTTWEQLVAHATYPKEATEITNVAIDLPIGHRDCFLYTVTEEPEGVLTVTRAWFAKDLPGAPVKHEIIRGTSVFSRMVMVEHDPGR